MVRLLERNLYCVTTEGRSADDGGTVFVRIMWNRHDDTTVYRCEYHDCHISTNSDKCPPCVCIRDVIEFCNSAGLGSKPVDGD